MSGRLIVRVVGAEDLQTWFATTSPFCTVALQPNGLTHRTRVLAEPGPDPTWEEEFRFSFNTEEHQPSLLFQIFDSDVMSHDFMAGGSLPLDSVLANQGNTIDTFVDLSDGGGCPFGVLRVLVSFAVPTGGTRSPFKLPSAPQEAIEPEVEEVPAPEPDAPLERTGPWIRNVGHHEWMVVERRPQLAQSEEEKAVCLPPSTMAPGDYRSPWAFTQTAEAARAAAEQRYEEDKAYFEASQRRAKLAEERKKASDEVARRLAEEQERRRQVEVLQKSGIKHASEMTITRGQHHDYPAGAEVNVWSREGNFMVAKSVKWMSVSGMHRMNQGVFKVVWSLKVERSAQLDTLHLEVNTPWNHEQLIYNWDTVSISRARGKGFQDLELGTIRVGRQEEPYASFRLWNHSAKVKQGLTVGAIRFVPI